MNELNALGPALDIAALSTGESIDCREYKHSTEKNMKARLFN